VTTRVNKPDADANLKSIREAARQADWQVFSLHNHEFGAAARMTAKSDTEMEDPHDREGNRDRAAVAAVYDRRQCCRPEYPRRS
jgi:hypothetical protein